MNINFDITLTPSQKEAYDLINDDDVSMLILAWSRQSGKSTLMKIMVVSWLLGEKSRTAYICRTYGLAKRFFGDIAQSISKLSYISSNSVDMIIRNQRNGSSIQFFSAESGHAIRGHSFNYLICDEFAFFPITMPDGGNLYYDVLAPTMKVNGRKTVIVSTPNGRDNLFYELYQKGLSGDGPIRSLRKTVYDDGLISEAQIEEIRKSVPPLSFSQEYMVNFLDAGQSMFKGFEKCFRQFSFNFDEDIWAGVDFSSIGEDRTILTYINSSMQVYQRLITGSLDERYMEIARCLDGIPALQNCLMESNSIGMPMINEIRKLVRPGITHKIGEFNTSHKSKDGIISSLAVAIANGVISFNDNELYSELASFGVKYTRAGTAVYQAIGGKHDDRVMSLAIALKAKEKMSVPLSKTISIISERISNIID